MIDWREARNLFRDGFDTAEIADQFGAAEADIYNGLAQGRGQESSEVGHEASSQAA